MSNKKIVISEDDEYIADFITHILKGSEFDVRFARNGSEAVELVSKEMPDLLIMDYMTPRLNAAQICEELSKNESTKNIPKIIMTASSRDEVKGATQKYGIKILMKKPFFANELMKNIRDALAS